MPEIVYLRTVNPNKLQEYKTILGRHRIVVEQASHDESDEVLFGRTATGTKVLAVLEEESNLYDPDQTATPLTPDELTDLRSVQNITRLTGKIREKTGAALIPISFAATVDGFIAPAPNPIDGESDLSVFGWDEQFVSLGTQMTYHEMRKRGLKLSARDLVLAQLTDQYLSFGKLRDLVADPQNPERTVDFRRRPIDYVRNNPFLNNSHIDMYGLQNLQREAINLGPFFRASPNRRVNIYWNPGGNGGLPYTPKVDKRTKKPDQIHQTTYFDHDLGHHVLNPDLIFEGATDPLSLKIQTLWRMMSEALTLVKADMLFVDTMVRSGVEYDFSKRKIYPLFASLTGDFTKSANLRKLFYANVKYALLGDDSLFRELGANEQALDEYESKYSAYFVEDYRWTEQNIKNMCESAKTFQQWRKSVQPLMELSQYTKGCIPVSACMQNLQARSDRPLADLPNEELIELMFAMVFETTIEPCVDEAEVEIDDDKALKSGFMKYMMAQMYIFDVYDFIPESAKYRERILHYLKANIETLTQDKIDLVRNHFSQFVDILADRNAITEEERNIYKEIFPLFPPFYINYDKSKDSYESIATVSSRILGTSK